MGTLSRLEQRVVQLDKLNDDTAVIVTKVEGQPAVLKTVDLP